MLYPAYKQGFILTLSGVKSNFDFDPYYNNKESMSAILKNLNNDKPYSFLTDIFFLEKT